MLKFFTWLEMPVNISQHRGSAGIFNNRSFAFRAKLAHFIGVCWSTNYLCFKLYLPIFLMSIVLLLISVIAFLSPRCSFYITPRNTYSSILVFTFVLLFNYLWFTCNSVLLCGDVELNPDPNQNTAKNFCLPLEL